MSAFCLMFHTIKLMAIKPEQFIPKSQLRASKILFSIAVGALVLTCISIVYSLVPKAYYFLPMALLPSLLVAGFHFLYGANTDDGNEEISSAQIKALKKALKRATQLTMSLVTTSFTGFIGLLLANYKAASLGAAAYSGVKVSVNLLLAGGIAGTFALLLCRLLSSNGGGGRRRLGTTWQRAILTTANIIMTFMVVPAILIIAETILHGLLVGAMFPVLVGAAAWLLVAFCTEAVSSGTEDGDKSGQGTAYAIAVAVASVAFGTIIAIFAGMLGGVVDKEQVKACTFLLASAFVAAVSLGVVTSGTAWMDKVKPSTEFAVTVLVCCGLGTLLLAALALFYEIAA
nr:unnamed protein product [Digitaria exilis]